jgi:hypothetical protein
MGESQRFDPRDPVHNMTAFVKLLGDASGERDAVNWYKGSIFSVIGDEKANTLLIGFEGFSVCRTIPQDDGTFMNLQREVLYYTHPFTGEILDTWQNPFTEEEVRVVHVYNDPVNSRYAPEFEQKFGDDGEAVSFPFILPWTFMGDTAMTVFDVNASWKNVLTPDKWRRESSGERVRVCETLTMFLSRDDLDNPDLTAIPYNGAWQRMSPWCPWMLMGRAEGHLFYRSHYRKLPGGVAELPAHLRDYTEKNFPDYLTAPDKWTEPNLTSFETYARDQQPAA